MTASFRHSKTLRARRAIDALFERTVTTDGALAANEIVLSLIEAIDSHVWGQGFPAPLFDNEFVVVEQRLVKDRHLKLILDLDGRPLRCHVVFAHRTGAAHGTARVSPGRR